ATFTSVPTTGNGPYILHVDAGDTYYLAWDAAGTDTRYFNFSGTFTPDAQTPPAVGSVQADVTVEGGLALGERACFVLNGTAGPVGSVQCADPTTSSLTFPNVPVGSYSVALQY